MDYHVFQSRSWLLRPRILSSLQYNCCVCFRESGDDHRRRQGNAPIFSPVGQSQQTHSGVRSVWPLHGDARQRSLIRSERGNANGELRDRRSGASSSGRLGDNAATMSRPNNSVPLTLDHIVVECIVVFIL